MSESREQRRELRARYEDRRRESVVYLLRNTVSGRILVASTPDLASLQNRLEFGRSTGSVGVLDMRLAPDARRIGVDAFELEVLDRLDAARETTDGEILADLCALEDLWREKLAATPQY